MKSNAQLRRDRQARAYADLFGVPVEPAQAPVAAPRPGPVHSPACCKCGAWPASFYMPEPHCHCCWSETPYGQALRAEHLRRLLGE